MFFHLGYPDINNKCTYTTEEEPENTIVLTTEESNIDYKAKVFRDDEREK